MHSLVLLGWLPEGWQAMYLVGWVRSARSTTQPEKKKTGDAMALTLTVTAVLYESLVQILRSRCVS